jgi:predicted aspartyl protease
MRVTRFDRTSDLILVPAYVLGPGGTRAELQVVLDTGASVTVIAPYVLDRMGYSPRDGEAITTMRSAIGAEPGYLIRVSRFRALGHELRDFRVHAHDLPEGYEIHGLLGLNFLRHFNYEIRSKEGRVLAQRLNRRRKRGQLSD